MVGVAGLLYGMLLSFVLSSASYNHKKGRPHPPVLVYVGYALCGLSVGGALFFSVRATFMLANYLMTA
jgi:hypothetical protein